MEALLDLKLKSHTDIGQNVGQKAVRRVGKKSESRDYGTIDCGYERRLVRLDLSIGGKEYDCEETGLQNHV